MNEDPILQVTDMLLFDQRLRVRQALEREIPNVKLTICNLLREQGGASDGVVEELTGVQQGMR